MGYAPKKSARLRIVDARGFTIPHTFVILRG